MLVVASGGGFFGGAAAWTFYDADTGTRLFTANNIPTGYEVLGPNGEHLRYVYQNGRLLEWNSSRMWTYSNDPFFILSATADTATVTTTQTTNTTVVTYVNNTEIDTITPVTTTTSTTAVDAVTPTASGQYRFDWNVSSSYLAATGGAFTTVEAFYGDMLIGYNGTLPGLATGGFGVTSSAPYTYFAINLNATRQSVGSLLWKQTYNAPPGNVTVLLGPVDNIARIFTEAYKETRQWVGYSMDDGTKVWGPTTSQAAFDYYGTPAVPNVQGVAAFGKLYSSGFSGILYCYDMTNGNVLFTYGNGGAGNSTNAGFYNGYGDYPTFINAIGTDASGNKIVFLVTTEHTVTTPIYKGALARAVSADTGAEIWTLSDYTGEFATTSFAIADGFETFFNGYDNNVYSVGRGPSQTTVSAPATGAAFETSVVISGTVTDIAAGTTQNEQAARFPAGVPCASDASMKDWMGYVYQQKPLPTTFTGVNVVLSVLDPNNNAYSIGNVTTDNKGFFSLAYTPEVAGKYTVTATFPGSNGYWPSSAESVFNVMEQPASTPAATPTPVSQVEQYFFPAITALFILIIVIGAAIILSTRRRA